MDVLTKENFFRPNENVHIQLSDEYPNYIGIWHTHNYDEILIYLKFSV